MIDVGLVGGAGYVAGELLRLLLRHPHVRISSVVSSSHAGQPVWAAHPDLEGDTTLAFDERGADRLDVVFLCLGHGHARTWMREHPPAKGTLVIDLSQDFRVTPEDGFIYGLPELHRDTIASARAEGRHIANPGCFATALQLALLPLATAGQLRTPIHASAITGSTGAGQAHTAETHFSWRHANLQVYQPFTHRHLPEVRAGLAAAQPGFSAPIHFIPYRGPFTRGILASVYVETEFDAGALHACYQRAYGTEPFVTLTSAQPDVKRVVNTNRCLVHVELHDGVALATAAIDNLLKGASGQAVQNMNLACGFEETAGLTLKPSAY